MNLLRSLLTVLVCFSVATMLAEGVLLAVLWHKGHLKRETITQLLAVAYDVDLATMWREVEAASRPIDVEQISFVEVQEARKLARLDLDLREMAADKGLIDVRQLDYMLSHERQEYETLKQAFDQQIEQVRQGAADGSLKELQRQLESVDAKLAKDQILRILNDTALAPEAAMQSVVTMFKNMPLDKRKKIISEFKTPEESQQLQEVLRQVRLGAPDVDVLQRARQQMEAFDFRE